jgi:hypothetical protein
MDEFLEFMGWSRSDYENAVDFYDNVLPRIIEEEESAREEYEEYLGSMIDFYNEV